MMSTSSTIRVAHSAHGAGNTPLAMAIANGFFEERGIHVVADEVPVTSVGVGKLFSGEVEAAVSGSAPIIHAAVRGDDPVILMSIESENVFAVMGARHVTGPDDLRGTEVGIGGRTGNDMVVLHRALREWGIDPDVEVRFVERSSRGDLWDAMLAGEITAMAATIPQPILARALGIPVLRDFAELHEPFQAGCIVMSRRFVEDRPETVDAFLAGHLEGIRAFQSDFEAALPYMRQRSKLDDADVLAETHRLFSEAMEAYVPREEALATVIRDMQAATGAEVGVDVSAIVDPSFALRL